ncbi:MAG: carboxypeptidase-like regulatory domain-containing protein, partial [Candidatus Izemoplasmatales bacterium]
TFSDIYSAITQSQSYRPYVKVQSDSPHTSEVAPWVFPEYLDDDISILDQYTLSGSVSGETVVTGATVQLIYPNENYETQITDSFGNFYFQELESGVHTLNVFYRGYESASQSVNITANTTVDLIRLKLIWGNSWDTWGDFSDLVPYI